MLSEKFRKIATENGYIYNKYIVKNEINNNADIEISVLIPVYNGEKTIKRCLDSIKNQTLAAEMFEVIVVNDGSNDSTAEILTEYSNIKVITQENKGISKTRNKCLENANGKYIAFIDSDDYIDKDYLKILYEVAKKDDLDFVKCGYNLEKDNKIIYKNKLVKSSGIDGLTKNELNIDGYLWAALFKKEILYNICFPEDYWFEDMITKTLIYSRIKRFRIISENLYYYIDYEKSATKIQGKLKNIKNLDEIFLIDEILQYKKTLNENINEYFILTILNELYNVLPIRLRKIEEMFKKMAFYEACDIVKKLNLMEIHKKNFKYINIFKYRRYILWKNNCIIRKIMKKIERRIKWIKLV